MRFELLLNEGVIGVVGITNFFLLDRLRRRSSHARATRNNTPPAEATTIPAISPVESNTPGELNAAFPDESAVGSAFGLGGIIVEDVLDKFALDDDADVASTPDVLADEELAVPVALEVLVLVEAPLNAVEDAAIATRAVNLMLHLTNDSVAL
ncbi:hypothetical protein KCU92_g1912, partial [Aureobasidium melanogenum]|jgi:hypothetical protein